MSARERLPNRRLSESFSAECALDVIRKTLLLNSDGTASSPLGCALDAFSGWRPRSAAGAPRSAPCLTSPPMPRQRRGRPRKHPASEDTS
jgi:hypothetical protein